MMAGESRLSEVIYDRVREIIGCQEVVKMRRDGFDIIDKVDNYLSRDIYVKMTSGSMREGFYFEGSDYDLMYWFSGSHVICNLSQIHIYNQADDIILMVDQNTRPGFVFLQVFNQTSCIFTSQCLLQLNGDDFYISNLKFRHGAQSWFNQISTTIHGPCTSAFIGGEEFDFAFCCQSKHWPPQAYHWINRCQISKWPPPSVLRSIIQNGCHFMAIGAKNSPSEVIEWRLSFSQAEQKLVYCMSQCQFLIYGLLKLFLKEVLNKGIPDDQKLLCSYFMKTAVFWEIQQNFIMHWNPENFLSCFWSCYKCLMKWVYNEYCPNFFVPQNNMFYPKITGPPHQQLFRQMFGLYSEGFHCLLRCSSIHDRIYSALIYPQQPMINMSSLSEFEHDLLLYKIIVNIHTDTFNEKPVLLQTLSFLITELRSNISQTQRILLNRYIIIYFQHLTVSIQSNSTHESNTQMYKIMKQGLKIMEITSKLGCVADVLYFAVYHYNDGRYRHTLNILQRAQPKLFRPYIMYNHISEDDYLQAICGQSMAARIKKAWAFDIHIHVHTHFPELRLELIVTEQMEDTYLCVSPFVLFYFLSFLCYYYLDSAQQNQSLYDLHMLVHCDDGKYLRKEYKDIAWEMLGICHHLSAQPQRAVECFWRVVLEYSPFNVIKQAALCRMHSIERQYYNFLY